MRVLLIEDDRMIADALCVALRSNGISVDVARHAGDAGRALQDGGHALVLLDLGLPSTDGLDLLRAARAAGNETPILIITARDEVDARVHGLNLGADDYLVKPFETRELLARMRAVQRRRTGRAVSRLVAGPIELDPETHELRLGDTIQVLPAREFSLMLALMERPGRILSRSQIEERIYGWGEEVESNAVDVLIHSIRRRFGKGVVVNVRGAGWMVPRR